MAGYAESNLLRNEVITYTSGYHWIHFFTKGALLTLFILPIIQLYTDEYVITNRRVIIKKGLIARYTLEMNLQKIETVNVDQSILGRILNYGCITIVGTGGTREHFHDIKDPIAFRNAFMENDLNPR
jgi:uncharacterized membrane protein YdbT with pleckstrin-like domain